MKKFAYILFLVLCGALEGTAAAAVRDAVPRSGAECAVTSSSEEQWRCEEACNSDLVPPRAAAEVEPVRMLSVWRTPCPERLGVKCGVVCGRAGTKVGCFPEFIFDRPAHPQCLLWDRVQIFAISNESLPYWGRYCCNQASVWDIL